jgi:predicted Na+-dependent transporter
MLCVVTNIVAVITVPFYIKWFSVFKDDVTLDVTPLIRDLILTILVPFLV